MSEEEADPTTIHPPSHARSELPRIEYRTGVSQGILYFVSVSIAAVASWICILLPYSVSTAIALLLGRLFYFTARGFRSNVELNMSNVLDKPPDSKQVKRATQGIFETNARNTVDLLRSPHLSPQEIRRIAAVDSGSWAYLDAALAKGNGGVILTAHLGAFDLVGSALVYNGYPITVLTTRTTNRLTFHAVTFLRGSHGIRLLDATSRGVREVYREVKQGRLVVLLSDRDFFDSGKSTMFFGEQTTLPVGVVRLSRETGAPIVPIFTVRRDGRNSLQIKPPYQVPRTGNRDADVAIGLEWQAKQLEQAIGHYPDQWVMFQPVWPRSYH